MTGGTRQEKGKGMDKKQSKRKVTKRFFVVLFCGVVVYAGIALFSQYKEMRRLQAEYATLSQQKTDSEMEMDKLLHMLQTAQTDAYIESVAREKLGWVKPGETRYVIEDE